MNNRWINRLKLAFFFLLRETFFASINVDRGLINLSRDFEKNIRRSKLAHETQKMKNNKIFTLFTFERRKKNRDRNDNLSSLPFHFLDEHRGLINLRTNRDFEKNL